MPLSSSRFIELPNGVRIAETHRYDVYDVDVRPTAHFPAATGASDEDVWWIHNLYAVVGNQFCEFVWREQWGHAGELLLKRIVFRELVEEK
jgi:hypothetical protein